MFNLSQRTRPIVKWAGGKSLSLAQMIDHFPKSFERYFEPFAGGAALFLSLGRKVPAFLNDSNDELMTLYQVVKTQPEKLMQALEKLQSQYSEAFYYQLRAEEPTSEVGIAARFLFLNKTCFNGLYRQNSKGQFNSPFGHRVRCPDLYDKKSLLEVSLRLEAATLLCEDFSKTLERARAGDFVYCDPPYVALSKTASFSNYTAHGFSLAAQEKLRVLAIEATARGAFVALSNSSSALVKKMYRDFTLIETQAKRSINSHGGKRGEVSEVLILMSPQKKAIPRKSGKKSLVISAS